MARWKVSEQAERALEAWLDRLQRGQIQIQDLPPSVAAYLHAGEAYGRAARQPEIDHLNHQLDVYWARAFLTNDERRERILQRLDRGLQEADEATWERIEQQLAAASTQPTPAQQADSPQAIRADTTSAERGRQCQPQTTNFGTPDPTSQPSGNGRKHAA